MKKLFGKLTMMACLALGAVALTTGCAGDRTSRSTGVVIDDAAITTKVKAELLADADVKGLAVNVETYNGRVQLSGFVDTIAQKNKAAQVARQVSGVQWVKNDLVVK